MSDLVNRVKASAKEGVEKAKPVTTFVGMNSVQIGNFLQEKYALQIAQLLPVTNKLSAERIIAQAVLVIGQNDSLKECTPQSIIGAIMKAAMYGFNPNPEMGQCWFIPYNNNNKQVNGQWLTKKECQFQIGVRGWVKLLQNTGLVKRIINKAVHIEENFKEVGGSKSEIIHDISGRQVTWETLHCAYAIIHIILKDNKGKILLDNLGQPIVGVYDLVMYKDEIDRLRKKGVKAADKSKLQGGWVEDAGEMAKAKVLKKLIKDELSYSDELMGIVNADEQIFDISDANMATKELIPTPVEETAAESENVDFVDVQETVAETNDKNHWVGKTLDFLAEIHKNGVPKDIQPLMIHNICSLIENGTTPIEYIPNELLSIKEIENAIFEREKKGIIG